MIAIRTYLIIYPKEGGHGTKMPFRERVAAISKVFPIFLIFVIMMGGLYLGFFTATESAAVGVVLVLIFIFFRGQLKLSLLKDALWTTVKTVGSLYLIVIGASISVSYTHLTLPTILLV